MGTVTRQTGEAHGDGPTHLPAPTMVCAQCLPPPPLQGLRAGPPDAVLTAPRQQKPHLAHGDKHPSTGCHACAREQLLQTLCQRMEVRRPARSLRAPPGHPRPLCLLGPHQGPAPLTFAGHAVQAVQGMGIAAGDREWVPVRPSPTADPRAPRASSLGSTMRLARASGAPQVLQENTWAPALEAGPEVRGCSPFTWSVFPAAHTGRSGHRPAWSPFTLDCGQRLLSR